MTHTNCVPKSICRFFYCPVAGKALAQIRVKMSLVSMTSSSTKCYWLKGGGRIFCHEEEVFSGMIGYHSHFGHLVCCRLTNRKAKTNQGEISADTNHKPLVIKPHQAWVRKYCLLDNSKRLLGIIRPVRGHYLGVFMLGGELAQRCNVQLEVVYMLSLGLSLKSMKRTLTNYGTVYSSNV